MVKNSFIFLPGIGEKRERALWKDGYFSWYQLHDEIPKYLIKRKSKVMHMLYQAEGAIQTKDISFFLHYLPSREYWRLVPDFFQDIVFLDIETTGLSIYYDKIILVNCLTSNGYMTFVRGGNLEELKEFLKQFKIVVTFNGKLFDVPFLKKELPGIEFPPLHLDLRFLLRSLGISGTLKSIESGFNLKRDPKIKELTGKVIPILWNKFLKYEDSILLDILEYGYFDVRNLVSLLKIFVLRKLEGKENFLNIKIIDKIKRKLEEQERNIGKLSPSIQISSLNNGGKQVKVIVNNQEISIIKEKSKTHKDWDIFHLVSKIEERKRIPLVVGVDLSSSEEKNTGVCVLDGNKAVLLEVKSDREILSIVERCNPFLVSIDSPLSLPQGRCCVHDYCKCRIYGIVRECERILKKRGINVYPCLIKSMQKLTERGIALATQLRAKGFKVIESYPGAAQDVLGLPRKQDSLEELTKNLVNLGIDIISFNGEYPSHDEIDALTSALVGYFYLADSYEKVGIEEEGYIILPLLERL